MNTKTRRQIICSVECSILGKSKLMPLNKLPTIKDVLLHTLYLQNKLELDRINRNLIKSHAVLKTVNTLEDIWKRSSIPTVHHAKVLQLVRIYENRRGLLLKSFKRDQFKPKFQLKIKCFAQKCDNLLDLAYCKCNDYLKCHCSKGKKVFVLNLKHSTF